MKVKNILLLIAILSFWPAVNAQDYQKTGLVRLIHESEAVLTLEASAYSDKRNKSDLTADCEKNAFEQLLFTGISGLNNGEPLVMNPDKARREKYDYFNRLFDGGRYTVFISSSELINFDKTSKGEFKGTVKLSIYYKSLLNDLEKYDLLRKFGVGEEKYTVQPTIMVIPYKTAGQTYQEVLQNDFDKRVAISKVQEGFNKKDFKTIDFEAKLNASLRASNFEQDSKSSMDKQLIRNSGSDIYVTVDIDKDFSPSGNQVSLIIKGYETASGRILASSKGWSGKFRTSQLDRLCELAVDVILEDFLHQVDKNFKKITDEGNTIVLNLSVANGSQYDFDTGVTDLNMPLSDILRMWVKNNSENNYYHLQGVVAESMIFDEVRIPMKDKNDNSYTVNDFAFDIWNYINNVLQIPCKKRVDGQTVYIEIQ